MTEQGELFELNLETNEREPAMLKAAKIQIESLKKQKLLTENDVLTCQTVLSLAEAIGKAAAKGQASAMSFATKELREWQAMLPKPVAISTMEELQKAMVEIQEGNSDNVVFA